jgi:hypothetical protein
MRSQKRYSKKRYSKKRYSKKRYSKKRYSKKRYSKKRYSKKRYSKKGGGDVSAGDTVTSASTSPTMVIPVDVEPKLRGLSVILPELGADRNLRVNITGLPDKDAIHPTDWKLIQVPPTFEPGSTYEFSVSDWRRDGEPTDANQEVKHLLNSYKAAMQAYIDEGGDRESQAYKDLEFKVGAISISAPLMVTDVMKSSEKNFAAILGGAKKATTVIGMGAAGAIGGPVAGALVGGITRAVVVATETIYAEMEGKGSERKFSSDSHPKEDHRMFMALAAYLFRPRSDNEIDHITLFHQLIRLWIVGGTLINREWYGQPPNTEIVSDNDPRKFPTRGAKELYDRIYGLMHKYIKMDAGKWNTLLVTSGNQALLEKIRGQTERRQPSNSRGIAVKVFKSLTSEFLQGVVGEIDLDGFSESLKEMVEKIDGEMPGMDVSELLGKMPVDQAQKLYKDLIGKVKEETASLSESLSALPVDKAKQYYEDMKKKSPCTDEGVDCKEDSPVLTTGSAKGKIISINRTDVQNPIYKVGFSSVALDEAARVTKTDAIKPEAVKGLDKNNPALYIFDGYTREELSLVPPPPLELTKKWLKDQVIEEFKPADDEAADSGSEPVSPPPSPTP